MKLAIEISEMISPTELNPDINRSYLKNVDARAFLSISLPRFSTTIVMIKFLVRWSI